MPGVAFGDPEMLRHVTVFEMNYTQFGRWACALCADARLARTGVAVQCDAGMCKSRSGAGEKGKKEKALVSIRVL